MVYFAIIGDIIGSKDLEDRAGVQRKLKNVLKGINQDYKANLASNFSITLGDEFQGLLKTAENLMEIMDIIRFQMYPVELRFGVGIGEMRTDVIYENSMGSDGPAYWAAREAICFVHDKVDYSISKIYVQTWKEDADEKSKTFDSIINTILKLCGLQEQSWTESQSEFVRAVVLKYRYQLDRYSQRKIACEMQISSQLLNSKIKNTGIITYIDSKKQLQIAMQKEWR